MTDRIFDRFIIWFTPVVVLLLLIVTPLSKPEYQMIIPFMTFVFGVMWHMALTHWRALPAAPSAPGKGRA